jgi:hypothetical protein
MGKLLTNTTYPQKFHPQVRRWDSSASFVTVNSNSYSELENGIQVKFNGSEFKTGDYWLIPARTASGDIEWPKNGKCPIATPPEGIVHRYCPLALIEYDQNNIKLLTDLRRVFETTVSITDKLIIHSGASSITLQPLKFKIIGPIHHKCKLAIQSVPPLVIVGLQSCTNSPDISNSQECSTISYTEDLSLIPLLTNYYGRVAGDSESEELVERLGLDGYLKPTSTVPPFIKPVSIDTEKFYVLAINYNQTKLTFGLRWWAIPCKQM